MFKGTFESWNKLNLVNIFLTKVRSQKHTKQSQTDRKRNFFAV